MTTPISPEHQQLITDALNHAPQVLDLVVNDTPRSTISFAVAQLATAEGMPDLALLAAKKPDAPLQRGLVHAGIGAINRHEDAAVNSLHAMGLDHIVDKLFNEVVNLDYFMGTSFNDYENVGSALNVFPNSNILGNAAYLIRSQYELNRYYNYPHLEALAIKAPDPAHTAKHLRDSVGIDINNTNFWVLLDSYKRTGDVELLAAAGNSAINSMVKRSGINDLVRSEYIGAIHTTYAAMLKAGRVEEAESFARQASAAFYKLYSAFGGNNYKLDNQERDARGIQKAAEEYDIMVARAKEINESGEKDQIEPAITPVSEAITIINPITQEHLLARTFKALAKIVAKAHFEDPLVPPTRKRAVPPAPTPAPAKRGLFGRRK